jgi:hypothetical protein
MKWVRRTGNGLGDCADNNAEKVQREQHPGDHLQTGRVRGDEWVAPANRLNDREQPLQDGMIEWNRGETEARRSRAGP